MKTLLSLCILASGLVFGQSASAQTIALPNVQRVDYIDYGTYANLFDDDIPVVINGVNYYVSISAHLMPDMTFYTPYSSIQFWNQATGATVNIPLTGTISSYENDMNAQPVIQGSFSGVFSGSFTLNLLPYHPTKTGRWSYLVYWEQVNSTLTLTQTP
jgi:hypothetical protein